MAVAHKICTEIQAPIFRSKKRNKHLLLRLNHVDIHLIHFLHTPSCHYSLHYEIADLVVEDFDEHEVHVDSFYSVPHE